MGKIIRRILTIIPAVALQSLWLLLLMKWLTPYAPIIVSLLSVAAFFLVVFIIIKRDETAYKLLWLLVILSLPLVGALLYLLFGNKRTARPLKKALAASSKELQSAASSNKKKRPLTAKNAWGKQCGGWKKKRNIRCVQLSRFVTIRWAIICSLICLPI